MSDIVSIIWTKTNNGEKSETVSLSNDWTTVKKFIKENPNSEYKLISGNGVVVAHGIIINYYEKVEYPRSCNIRKEFWKHSKDANFEKSITEEEYNRAMFTVDYERMINDKS